MTKLPDPIDFRKPEYPIGQLFVRRWSPRAMTAQSLDRATLMSLFEAARWAPSTYNEQEWRFVFALRETPHWNKLFGFLAEANQVWCENASVLVVVFSHKLFKKNGKPNLVHSFDAGAAFQNLALQGSIMNLVVHGMAGFDKQAVRTDLEIPDEVAIEAMIAIGFPAEVETLPPELQQKEFPSGRKRVCEIVAEGNFHFECDESAGSHV